MHVLYIDHSIVTHEPSWAGLRRPLWSGKIRLALSVWNLFEIRDATDDTAQAATCVPGR
jgi:hypothetical protein